jgi:hypothetical protein
MSIEAMKLALEDVERTWLAAESAIETARLASEKAYKTCGTVRGNWHPEDGKVILDFYDAANRVAVAARWRVGDAQKKSLFTEEEIAAGFNSFYALEAAHGITGETK